MQLNLKAARYNCGMTQAQLAEKMGVSAAQISNWERGINDMSVTQFFKLCDILGVKYHEIFLPSQLSKTEM